MKRMRCFIVAAMFAVLTGCASTPGTTGSQAMTAEPEGDGAVRQKVEFRHLPAEMQEAIMHGG